MEENRWASVIRLLLALPRTMGNSAPELAKAYRHKKKTLENNFQNQYSNLRHQDASSETERLNSKIQLWTVLLIILSQFCTHIYVDLQILLRVYWASKVPAQVIVLCPGSHKGSGQQGLLLVGERELPRATCPQSTSGICFILPGASLSCLCLKSSLLQHPWLLSYKKAQWDGD